MINVQSIDSTVSKWGEGAIWHEGKLLYVDIEGHLIHEFDPKSQTTQSWNVGQRVGTVVPAESGKLLWAGDHGFYLLDRTSGESEALVDPEPTKANNRFNDGKVSPDGLFFAGTISLVKEEGDAALYQLTGDKKAKLALDQVTNSNGIVWTADGATCYYIDTPRRQVLAFDYIDSTLQNERVVVDTSAIDASPDGMAIDENDQIWVAFCHGACVAHYNPKTGEELQRVAVPALETTSCAFGGENLDELYITTGIHKTEVEADAGKLFVVTGLGVKGQKASVAKGF